MKGGFGRGIASDSRFDAENHFSSTTADHKSTSATGTARSAEYEYLALSH